MERLKQNFAMALALGAAVYLVLALLSGAGDLGEALDRFEWTVIPVTLALGDFLRRTVREVVLPSPASSKT